MYNYSIMALDTDHLEEICRDVKEQYLQGVTDCALFLMTLMPEGTPPVPKAEQLCEKYDLFRERLAAEGVPTGILMQASIGHGYSLNERAPYQRYVNLTNGEEVDVACPYDPGFQEYISHAMEVLASHRPQVIMVDDDFRLVNCREGKGCACPRHLAEFNRRTGLSLTREELYACVMGDTAEDDRLREIYLEVERDSLRAAARAMRAGIDRVDPRLPGLFCCVGNACEAAVDIATILAGEGNPVVVRLNNGNYTPVSSRFVSQHMQRAATQIAVLRAQGHVDAFLAETDTCPQNRYSTGAQSLHTHFTSTILEGASGAKHWITRLGSYEPKSGKAYRKILAKNAGFYRALAELTPSLQWTGCRIPVSSVPDFGLKQGMWFSGWAMHVLERLGLPLYFSDKADGAAFLDSFCDQGYTDAQLEEMFKETVFLDGEAAVRLNDRGMERYIGVKTQEWTGATITGERLDSIGGGCSVQVRAKQLIPVDDTVQVVSMNYHRVGTNPAEDLFPAVTVYKNPLGGTTITFCGATKTLFNHLEAFSFLCESRKRQLVSLMQQYGDLPVYYEGDEEMLMKAAYTPEGELFCALFNLGLDPIEEIVLHCGKTVERVQMLQPDGSHVDVTFRMEEGNVIIDAPAYTLNPVILFLK